MNSDLLGLQSLRILKEFDLVWLTFPLCVACIFVVSGNGPRYLSVVFWSASSGAVRSSIERATQNPEASGREERGETGSCYLEADGTSWSQSECF